MPIIDITPIGSTVHPRPRPFQPAFLIVLQSEKNKTQKFVAIRLDEMTNNIKAVGFFTDENADKILTNYQEMLNTADKTLYKEMWFPWSRIVSIQNLVFKSK